MERRGIHAQATDSFLSLVRRAAKEQSIYASLDSVRAPDRGAVLGAQSYAGDVAALDELGRRHLAELVVIKLNGGRSTTMGGEIPKGILPAKNGRSYLDIISGQVAAFHRKWGVEVPLVLMNSFFTHRATLGVLGRFDIPVRIFMQSQVPRLHEDSAFPLATGTEEDWAPAGHGDVYESLIRTGLVAELLEEGRRVAFISNLDNLAAAPEPWILGLILRERIQLLLEVTDRTELDRKGGALVMKNGRLNLLEIAQVAPEEREKFMDIHEFPVFNTNNLWIDLEALSSTLATKDLDLPVIQNRKTIAGEKVVQIETAMGAAVGSFERARGLRVGRDRFFPTKGVEDLFALQSDACILDEMDRVRISPARPPELPMRPVVVFSPDFLQSALRMEERFEDASSVSLVKAVRLEVSGSVYFERDVTVEGVVRVEAPPGESVRIKRGSVLRDGAYP